MQKSILTDRSGKPQDSTKNSLIIAATKLFAEQGYHATSIADITNACKLTKSSYFHHFATKELIAFAVIDYLTHLTQQIFLPLEKKDSPHKEQVKLLLANIHNHLTAQENPLFTFLSIGLINTSDKLNECLRAYTNLWINQLTLAIQPLHKNPAHIAHHSLACLHGYMIAQNVYKQPDAATACCDYLLSLWTTSADCKIPETSA